MEERNRARGDLIANDTKLGLNLQGWLEKNTSLIDERYNNKHFKREHSATVFVPPPQMNDFVAFGYLRSGRI